MKKAEPIVRSAVDRLEALKLGEDDIRRLMENELAQRRTEPQGEETPCVKRTNRSSPSRTFRAASVPRKR